MSRACSDGSHGHFACREQLLLRCSKMTMTSTTLHLIVATLLILLGSEVVAQQPDTAKAAACFSTCEVYWSALQNQTSSKRLFLAQYQNSTQKASDYYCSLIANISACFKACKESYTQIIYQGSTPGIVTSLLSQCFTDEAQCRIRDSELWCDAYSEPSCGEKFTSYEKCLNEVQALRGCQLTNPTQKSQRMFLAKLLDKALYCLNDNDFFVLEISAQDCARYIPDVCLSPIDASTGSYNSYYMGNVTCSDIDSIKNCIEATLTQTVMFEGREYTKMCQSIPNSASFFSKLLSIVSNLVPCSQTTSVSTFTSATGPTIGVITVGLSETMTTKKQNLTIPTTHDSCTNSSGMPTRSSFVKIFLSAVIAVVLNVLAFWIADTQ